MSTLCAIYRHITSGNLRNAGGTRGPRAQPIGDRGSVKDAPATANGRLLAISRACASIAKAARGVNGHLPHVLVLDLRMPDGSSIELIRQLRVRVPETAIVAVTMEDSPAYARAAIDAGAVAFVLKEYATHDLPVAVRCAARGEVFVSARVGMGFDAVQRSVDDDDDLSAREVEVLRLIAFGFTSAEISRSCISPDQHGGVASNADISQAGVGAAFGAGRLRAQARPDWRVTAWCGLSPSRAVAGCLGRPSHRPKKTGMIIRDRRRGAPRSGHWPSLAALRRTEDVRSHELQELRLR